MANPVPARRSAACWWFSALLAGAVCLADAVPRAFAAEPPSADSVDRDYSSELPRIPPREPEEALKTFQVADGFRIEQAAAEPLVTDPVAMAFDENGRLFVVEMKDYSEDDKAFLGQVRMLEDVDGDGRFDKSDIYAEGLSWPTAILCYGGGVIVGAAPDIFYLRDNDGDRRAEIQQRLYTGFGRSNVQGLLNTFQWGLDNRIHGATSSSGGSVQRVAARLANAEDRAAPEELAAADLPAPVNLNGRDFSFDPRTLELTAVSGGAQHGMSISPWGDKFVCSNSDHIQQVMFEDRYLARNPYLSAPSPRISIAVDGPQADVFRTSPVEPWRIVRTRLRKQGIVPGPVEGGGRAAGYFTGATGVTLFKGDAWPQSEQPVAVVADVGSNLVHRKRLESEGVTFQAHRIDEQSEFVSSSDIWFRPVQFANGPDGALYIADMYREVIEHPASLHPVIKQHLDLTSGRDRGRIYRVVGQDFHQPPLPRLGAASSRQLADSLDTRNGWRRETAARLLYERQDASAVGRLAEIAVAGKTPEGRVAALSALCGLQSLPAECVLAALADEHPRVREAAVRFSESVAQEPEVRDALLRMANDPEKRVRYQTAFTLGELSDPRRTAALAAIVRRDVEDSWLLLAVHSSLAEGAGAVLADLLADVSFRARPQGLAFLGALATQIGRQQRKEDVALLLKALQELGDADPNCLRTVVSALGAKPGSDLDRQVLAATSGRSEAVIEELVASARQAALDGDLAPAARAQAVQSLRLGRFEDLAEEVLPTLLEPAQPAEVQAAAVTAIGAWPDASAAELLLSRWPKFTPALRARAGDVLFSRGPWLSRLIDALEAGAISPADLEPGRLKLLASHPDPSVRERAMKLLSKAGGAAREAVVADYRPALDAPGDAERGRAAFKKTCAACHRLDGVGHEIGPNLAAMRNRGPESILLNVLDPNREVNPQYLTYTIITTDGRALSGMIAAETATSITLRRADNASDTVLRIDIDEMRSSGVSLMPEGLEKEVSKQALADLIAYIMAH